MNVSCVCYCQFFVTRPRVHHHPEVGKLVCILSSIYVELGNDFRPFLPSPANNPAYLQVEGPRGRTKLHGLVYEVWYASHACLLCHHRL